MIGLINIFDLLMTTRTQGPSQSRYKHPFSPTILLESLTSTDKRIAGSSLKQTPHSENSQTYIPNRQLSHSSAAAAVTDSSAESVSFNEIDELCTSLRTNLASAQLILQKIQDKDSTGAEYLTETLRDVCDGLHQLLPPTPRFEAIVHQTLHQFLSLNKQQQLMDKGGADKLNTG